MGLVLERAVEASLLIGDDIEVKVVRIRGQRVKLLISGPRGIQVHRKEVVDAKRREALNKTPE